MNAFAQWIKKVGLRQVDVSRALGMPANAAWKHSRDKYWPRREAAMRIRRFTGGAVSMDDLLEDDVPPKETEEYQSALRAIDEARRRKREKRDAKRAKKASKSRTAASGVDERPE